ncbi:hypothetical protein [Halovivax sp.]|uniref:hypothetical protein n=1 Tax=Halovivax sp. TaxID=1935978 RepID=UPI0025C29EB2|nr:hypothetical protein [Halovivax sp.]
MAIDRRAAERRRFARLTGLLDGERTGLPVGVSQAGDDESAAPADEAPAEGADGRTGGDGTTPAT